MNTHIEAEINERKKLIKILSCAKEYLYWEMQTMLNEMGKTLNAPKPDFLEITKIHEKLESTFSKYIILKNFASPDSDDPIPIYWIEVALEIYKEHVKCLEETLSTFQYQLN